MRKPKIKESKGSIREPVVQYGTSRAVSMGRIQELVHRIVQQFDPDKVILFGSYAYGRPRDGSDVDICVIMDTQVRTFEQSLKIIRYLSPLHFGLDIVVRSEEDFKRRIPQGDYFLQEILEKGKVMYARGSS